MIRAFSSYQEIHIINKSQVQSSKVGVGNWKQKSECLEVKEVALPHTGGDGQKDPSIVESALPRLELP